MHQVLEQPVRLRSLPIPKLWGGNRLGPWIGEGESLGVPIGESWEVSGLPEKPSIVEQPGHPYHQKSLVDWLADDALSLLGTHASIEVFPLLYKFLETTAPLSVQVHPVLPKGPSLSKAEFWMILRADPDAEIYLGFHREVEIEEVRRRAADGSLPSLLHRFPVVEGDAFFVPPGTIHAIGGGLLLAEIQQTSDRTYRLFDWNRSGPNGSPRSLHLEQALACVDLRPLDLDRARPVRRPIPGGERLFEGPPFTVDRFESPPGKRIEVHTPGQFTILSVVAGCGRLEFEGRSNTFSAPASFLVPASAPPLHAVSGRSEESFSLLAFRTTHP